MVAWRSVLTLCFLVALAVRVDADAPLLRLPMPDGHAPPPDVRPVATAATTEAMSLAESDVKLPQEEAVVACSFLQMSPKVYDVVDSPSPTVLCPGNQYVGHHMDRWFSNRYGIGCGLLGIDAVVRGYYVNDQRIHWSGLEATFAAEAALTSRYERHFGEVDVAVGSDFFLTQPSNRNMLDDPERRSYFANYDDRSFGISQLYVEMRKGRFGCRAGKIITPFGRFYYPNDTNLQFDAPFIRTECIRRRETGILLQWVGQWLSIDAAGVNGCEDRDTNSSKGFVGRLGLNFEPVTLGLSAKIQDGIGSEDQKEFNNHAGVDASWRVGRWTFSTEVIYDEYGLFHDFDPDDIFWEHSLYFRQINKGEHQRITGVGWYVDCLYRGQRWLLELNYGQYHPEQLGIPQHDHVNQRGIVRVGYDITSRLQAYNFFMIEDDFANAQCGRDRRAWLEMVGLRYLF